jgi:hypothetical protein
MMMAKGFALALCASIALVSPAMAQTLVPHERGSVPAGVLANGLRSNWALQYPTVTGPQSPTLYAPGTTALQAGGGGAGCGVSPTGTVSAPATIVIDSGTCDWERWDFRGYLLYIKKASNVTLRNDLFDSIAQTLGGSPGSIWTANGYSGTLVVDHSDFDGGNGLRGVQNVGAASTGPIALTYNRFRNGQTDAVDVGCVGTCIITHNYFLNWGQTTANHADALTIASAVNSDVSDNFFAMTAGAMSTGITANIDNGAGRPGNILHVTAINGTNLACCVAGILVAIPGGSPSLVKITSGSGATGDYTINGAAQLVPSETMQAAAAVTDALRLVPNAPVLAHGVQSLISGLTVNNNIFHSAIPFWTAAGWGYAVAEGANGRPWATTSASWSGTTLTLNSDVSGERRFASSLYAVAVGMKGSPQITYTGPSSSFIGHFDASTSLTLDSAPSAGFAGGQRLYGANVKGEPRIGANTGGSGCPAAGCTYAVTGVAQTVGGSPTSMISDALGLAGSTYSLDIPQPSGSGPAKFGPIRNIAARNNSVSPGTIGGIICNEGANSSGTVHAATAASIAECSSP